jgi:hypothetical protein
MTRRIGQRLRTVDEPTCRQLTRLRQHLRTTVPLVCRVITQGEGARAARGPAFGGRSITH